MKSLFVITMKLNTLTDVPYQITVGEAFVYVYEKTCERGRVKDFEQRSRVYNLFLFPWTRQPLYNGVKV